MKPLETFADARAAGCHRLLVACDRCRRTRSLLLDFIERRTGRQSLTEMQAMLKCDRCGARPSTIGFTVADKPWIAHFEYAVVVWNRHRTEPDHVAAATVSLEEASAAFRIVAKRHPDRWVTLESRRAFLGDSDRKEALEDV